ncbi:hypothetical protein [Catenulispora subtropica]|uniref:Ig-like domain-containing protein n=1 Tax=Catenulispora subtropica TaxID=450798 RepID=A0ABP5CPY4_9ACTN
MSATASARADLGRPPRRFRILLTLFALVAGVVSAFLPVKAAHAALPDVWGYGYLDPAGPLPGPLTDSITSAGTVGQVSGSGGSYLVRFPNVAAPQGVVHVTAVAKTGNPGPQPPAWCEPDQYFVSGPDEMVKVSCWVQGAGTVSPFSTGFSINWVSATFAGAPTPDLAYAQSDGAAGLLSQFDSVGAPLSVGHMGVGVWQIKLPGVGPTGTTIGGDLQVTGQIQASGAPARCKVGAWVNAGGTQLPTVLCFDAVSGAPADTRWTLTYQYKLDLRGLSPFGWGYFWQHAGAPPLTDFDSVTSWTTVTSAGVPPFGITVLMPGIGVTATPYSEANVTAFGGGPGFCRLGEPGGGPPWFNSGGTLQIRSVDCFTGAGAPGPTDFFVTYTSK